MEISKMAKFFDKFANTLIEKESLPIQRVKSIFIKNKCSNYFSEKMKKTLGFNIAEQYITSHTTNTKIDSALKLATIFNNQKIDYLYVKGFMLSNLLYSNLLVRTFSDIDFIVKKEQLCKACELLERNGYTDILIDSIESALGRKLNNSEKGIHFLKQNEKTFYCLKDGINVSVEIKPKPYCIENTDYLNMLLANGSDYNIRNHKIRSLSFVDSLTYLFLNIYDNLITCREGIFDFSIRDLFDGLAAILTITELGLDNKIIECAAKYGFESKIATAVCVVTKITGIDNNFEIVKWAKNRINNTDKSLSEYPFLDSIIYDEQSIINNAAAIKENARNAHFVGVNKAIDVQNIYSVENGFYPMFSSLSTANIGNDILNGLVKYSVLEDRKNIYFVCRYTNELKNFALELGILNADVNNSQLNNITIIAVQQGKRAFIEKAFPHSEIIDKGNDILLKIPKEDISNCIFKNNMIPSLFFYMSITSCKYAKQYNSDTKFFYLGLREVHIIVNLNMNF